ncbi:MAG: hypothetical protein ACP5JU_01175 [Minisyncoccia bacterium]
MKILYYNLILVGFIFLSWSFLYFYINQPQIVFLYHKYPENYILSPKGDLFIFPIVFSLVILYNYLLRILGVKEDLIKKINLIIFLLNIAVFINIFYLNY